MQHHFRWACPHVASYASSETCEFCMCYLCKTDFSKHGCQTAAHRWAAPPGLDLWPLPHTDGADAAMPVNKYRSEFAWLKSVRDVPIGRNPGLKCAGVPGSLLHTYLQHAADGSIAHLLNTHQIVTPRNKRCFDLLLSLKATVTKPMIGNLQKPPPADDERLVCTVSYSHGAMMLDVYARSGAPWLELRPPGSLALLQADNTRDADKRPLYAPLSPSLIQPFQAKLLQRLLSHESARVSDLLWLNLAGSQHYVSRTGDWLSCGMADAHTPLAGIVCMPPGSGKTRVMAALIHASPMPTLVIVLDDAVAQHWQRELALFTPDHSTTIVTLANIANVAVGGYQRVIYDDCVRYLNNSIALQAVVQWALTTPVDYAKARPSAWLRFLFSAGAKPNDGLLGMVCHNYTHMTKAHNVVYAQLTSLLMFSEPVPPSLLPVCVTSTYVSTPDPTWLQEYVQCWHFVQLHHAMLFGHKRNIAGRFLGAVAGNMPFDTADEIGADFTPLPADDGGMCAICHESYVNPHRTECAHYFCQECINTWTDTEPSCPMCRRPLNHATAKPCIVGDAVVLGANSKKIADVAALAMSYITKEMRIVILSRYESVRRQLMQQLKSKMACASVAGCVTPNVTVFASDATARVLVAQPQALETKILQQCNVGTLIFAEPSVDAALQEQISRRLMRLGQSTQLYMITVVTANTYEAVMHTKTEQQCRELK